MRGSLPSDTQSSGGDRTNPSFGASVVSLTRASRCSCVSTAQTCWYADSKRRRAFRSASNASNRCMLSPPWEEADEVPSASSSVADTRRVCGCLLIFSPASTTPVFFVCIKSSGRDTLAGLSVQ